MKPDEQFYTINEVAGRLGVHHQTVRKLLRDRKLGSVTVGRRARVRQSDLDAYLQRYAQPAEAGALARPLKRTIRRAA